MTQKSAATISPRKATPKSPATRRRREYPRITGTEAARLLLDSGLLHLMNRTVMHPVGLVLGFEDNRGELTPVLIDRREHPICRFTEREFAAGMARFARFMDEQGRATTERRRKLLGYVTQKTAAGLEDDGEE